MTPERITELRMKGPGALYYDELISLFDEITHLKSELAAARLVPTGFRNAMYRVVTGSGTIYVERRKGRRWKIVFGQRSAWLEDVGPEDFMLALSQYCDTHFEGLRSIEEIGK